MVIEEPLKLFIMTKDKGIKEADIDVDDVLDAGGIQECIEEYVRITGKYPMSAFQFFSKLMKGLEEGVRIFKSIKAMETDAYFITPFAVLWEEEPIIGYKRGVDEIPIGQLSKLFELFGVADRIYALLESQPDFLVMIINVKIAKMLDLLSNISRHTIAFVISQTPLTSTYEHVVTIYPNIFYKKLLTVAGIKYTNENFSYAFLKALAKVFLKLYNDMSEENFYYFLKNAKDKPKDFFNLVLSEDTFTAIGEGKDESLLKFFK